MRGDLVSLAYDGQAGDLEMAISPVHAGGAYDNCVFNLVGPELM